MKTSITIITNLKTSFLLLSIVLLGSCEEFIQIDPPRTDLISETVFASEETAEAAMLDIYYQMRVGGPFSGSLNSISFITSLSSDEQLSYYRSSPTSTAEMKQFNDNALLPNNTFVLRLWSDMYKLIYRANAILEGLSDSTIDSEKRNQLLGEAKFIRAFCYFYLVNLYGDLPLVLTTSYQENSTLPRSPAAEVYKQIVDDLMDAKSKLKSDFSNSNNERVRPNQGTAAAMLARVYLFMERWNDAEASATEVISNPTYSLAPTLAGVFNTNGPEAIWQFWSNSRPTERSTFRFAAIPIFGAIRNEFIAGFEAGDLRRTAWIARTSQNYYSSIKYNSTVDNPPTQYATPIRLAEIILIRAEARINLGNLSGATADLNLIRQRAGLSALPSSDVATLTTQLQRERRSELFNEWGLRWLDINRWQLGDMILQPIKPGWKNSASLYPIPEYEIKNNSALSNAQNPGY